MAEQQAQSVIEAKLTKTEAIELMVADMLTDLRRAERNCQAEIKRLSNVSSDELLEYFDGKSYELSYSNYEGTRESVSVHVSIKLPEVSRLNPVLKERVARLRELHKQHKELNSQIHRLTSDKQSSKIALLKTILEGTPEGRSWLAQLEVLRHAAAKRLGTVPNARLLSGKE